MSKLRIVGGSVIVLFLFTIVALGILAINLNTVITQQALLAQDIAAVKDSITGSNSAAGTVLTGTDTNVGPADEPITTDSTTSAPHETINPNAMQTCTNDTLGIKLSAPMDWTCKTEGDLEGQSYLIMTKGDINFSVGSPGIGFICNENCMSYSGYKTERAEVKFAWRDAKIISVLGTMAAGKSFNGVAQPVLQIMVRGVNGEIGSKLAYQSEIFSMLDSITNL